MSNQVERMKAQTSACRYLKLETSYETIIRNINIKLKVPRKWDGTTQMQKIRKECSTI